MSADQYAAIVLIGASIGALIVGIIIHMTPAPPPLGEEGAARDTSRQLRE
jgi:hypothetical protein